PDFPRLRKVGLQPSTSDLLFFDNVQGISHAVSSLETCGPEYRRSYKQQQPEVQYMFRILATFALICAFLQVAPLANAATDEEQNSNHPVNVVIVWNRTLLAIVRTPGAQPATVLSTRNFAILHAAIYDAVNNIEPKFSPYLVRLPDVPRSASKIAAADKAAHECPRVPISCVSGVVGHGTRAGSRAASR